MEILACNSNLPLALDIAKSLGKHLIPTTIKRFLDGEIFVEVQDNVRGKDVFVVQSTSMPANENIMELLITLDALRRSSAKRITAVIPYFGYARQDRKSASRTPITAKLVANLITSAGADRVLTLDLHSGQIQGFFDIAVDNLYAAPVFVDDINKNFNNNDLMIVSPDVGGVVRARQFANFLGADLAIVDKKRDRANHSEVMNVIGDVKGRNCILIDDMVDSAGTICNAASILIEKGASSVTSYITHGVLSDDACSKIANSSIKEFVITDSIKLSEEALSTHNIRVVSIAPLMAEAIKRIADETSVSCLFNMAMK